MGKWGYFTLLMGVISTFITRSGAHLVATDLGLMGATDSTQPKFSPCVGGWWSKLINPIVGVYIVYIEGGIPYTPYIVYIYVYIEGDELINLISCWLNQPIWKNMRKSNWIISPSRAENQ